MAYAINDYASKSAASQSGLIVASSTYGTHIVLHKGLNVGEFSRLDQAEAFAAEPRRFGYFG